MLQLRVFGTSELIADLTNQLERIQGARHVIVSGSGASGKALVTADLVDDAVDQAIERVRRLGLPSEDVMVLRIESIGPSVGQRPLSSVVWADLLSQAGANAPPVRAGQARFLAGLSTVNISTPIVAFAAGVAAILALETRASSAVGVAISVTTIPASAYLGVATGVGDGSKALGALAVLGINIAMLLVGGSIMLLVQRALGRHEAPAAG
ncbi:MAG: DUF389 domain-containing protein [Solirubrobacteraceae bacterium]